MRVGSTRRRSLAPRAAALVLGACEPSSPAPTLDARVTIDATADAVRDSASADSDASAQDDARDASADDSAPTAITLPATITAQVVYTEPVGARTPPTWNAHLPKLTGDARDWYAVFTHYPQEIADRYAVIARRARSGPSEWQPVARLSYVHQPPGIVMTRAGALHLAFDCLRPSSADVQCFTGGAGTNGLSSRLYRLVFSARDADGALRWDTYGNYGEWAAESGGYLGLAVAPDDSVHWSLADSEARRVLLRASGAEGRPIATIGEAGRELLYPVSAWDGARTLLFVGEFDPTGGTNAGYPASSLYAVQEGLAPQRALRVTPEVAVSAGMIGAFPSDLDVAPDQTIYALAYQRRADGCTTLFRADRGARFVPLPVGCLDTYAQLQVLDERRLLIVASGAGRSMRVGISEDRGERWRWSEVAIAGVASDEQSLFGYTLVDDRSAPAVARADRVAMVFSGSDGATLSRTLYFAEWSLR